MINKKYFWHGRYLSEKQVLTLKENNFLNISKERHKQISSLGGKASGKIRRQRKIIKETTDKWLTEILIQEEYTQEFIDDFKKFRREKNRERTADKQRE